MTKKKTPKKVLATSGAKRTLHAGNQVVNARWTGDGRVVLHYSPGTVDAYLQIVTEKTIEEMLTKGELR